MVAGWAAAAADVGVDVGSDVDADVDADAECVELLAPQAARPPARQSARTAARITQPTIAPADYEPLTQPSVIDLSSPGRSAAPRSRRRYSGWAPWRAETPRAAAIR